jgi:hypothetical protein
MPGTGIHLSKVTNEKRGDLTAASFESSPFKLFSLKSANKSVQSSSCDCERHKTAQRTLFYYLQTLIVSQHRVKNCWRYLTTELLPISVR